MPATLREQRQRCRCSRRGPRSLGALISARPGLGMPAALREQRQRCRCSRRGPRSLGALISARPGSACRQLSASSGSAAAARGEVREAWAR
ncbi:Hypothetical predicted protein [Podarcis lilfordi]|uniref:Uncharacterized protein n=1 Tax=Podarcis lilfordi TaxID=74358 RepID=A0AA35K5E2_9SAUR|nr:Hypothetical predicted protein [Podarcis lilfordi]